MPYIDPDRRDIVKPTVPVVINPGELNYQLTMVMKAYWDNHEQNYQTASDISHAMEGALDEFKRLVLWPYEDKKIEQNGPVW